MGEGYRPLDVKPIKSTMKATTSRLATTMKPVKSTTKASTSRLATTIKPVKSTKAATKAPEPMKPTQILSTEKAASTTKKQVEDCSNGVWESQNFDRTDLECSQLCANPDDCPSDCVCTHGSESSSAKATSLAFVLV